MKTQPFGSYPAFSGLVHTAGTKKKGGVQNKGMAKTAENSKCTNLCLLILIVVSVVGDLPSQKLTFGRGISFAKFTH